MTDSETTLSTIMSAVLRRTRGVLLTTAAVNVDSVERFDGDIDHLELHDVTAVAGLGEPLGVLTAFSFEKSLLDVLFGRITADIVVPQDQMELYARDTAAEIVNTVVGLCVSDFPDLGTIVALTPPTVLDGDRTIDRRDHVCFGSMRVRTPDGGLSINLLRPHTLFDRNLNYRDAQ